MAHKSIDWNRVEELLAISSAANQWSNFGPVSRLLERRIETVLDISPEMSVVVTASGTAALDAISALEEHKRRAPVRWLVSDFGFHCTRQGPFREAIVVDCDQRGVLDLAEVERVDEGSYDAILVTNPFGVLDDLSEFVEFTERVDKLLVVDSAGAFDAAHGPSRHSPVEALSFHHTKPWGFGEGGAMIVRREDEAMARSVINFGLVEGEPVAGVATNGKMSEPAAAFILSWLDGLDDLRTSSQLEFSRIASLAIESGWGVLGGWPGSRQAVRACVALVSEAPVAVQDPQALPLTVRKYYTPLTGRGTAADLFRRIVNVPCHPEVAQVSDRDIITMLEGLIGRRSSR